MDEYGVTISFKEIYDEQKKTNEAIGQLNTTVIGLSSRVDGIEKRLNEKDKTSVEFQQKVKITMISVLSTAAIPVVFFLIYLFVDKGGL